MTSQIDIIIDVMAEVTGNPKEFLRGTMMAMGAKRPDALRAMQKPLTDDQVRAFTEEFRAAAPSMVSYFTEHPNQPSPEDQVLINGYVAREMMGQNAFPNVELRDRNYLHSVGMEWWQYTYKSHPNDEVAAILSAFAHWQEFVDLQIHDPVKRQGAYVMAQTEEWQMIIMGPARWADQAFPVVQLKSHRYAAALMSTKVPKTMPIMAPWQAFMIELPTGLMKTEDASGKPCNLTCLLVRNHDRYEAGPGDPVVAERLGCWSYTAFTDGDVDLHRWRQPTSRLREDEEDDGRPAGAFEVDYGSSDARTQVLLGRLMLNTCLAMSNPEEVKAVGKHPSGWTRGPGRDVGAPSFRRFVVGHPITVDCRPAMQDYISGRKPSPAAIQWLVRGHWRQQACGPHLSERRPTWIEPYWKGDPDAPINMRSHTVGS